jgi:hypothetical protein
MNDFGIFKALKDLVRADDVLSQKISAVVTELRPGNKPPFVVVTFEKSDVDIPCFVQTAHVTCSLEVTSAYHGDQEIHELLSRLNHKLDGSNLSVDVTALDAKGIAVFKLLGQEHKRATGSRIGTLTYQVKVNIRRN